jgi:hypothetical protein
MANEGDIWEHEDRAGDRLEVSLDGGYFWFIAMDRDRDNERDVALPIETARELRGWLTAKLEGNDGE